MITTKAAAGTAQAAQAAQATQSTTFDAIVVGSGITGGWAAKELCEKGLRTLCLEAGRPIDPAIDYVEHIAAYERPDPPAVPCAPRATSGHGCTEAPRGICWHRYELDAQGFILDAKIVPPTSQNLRTIESDLREFVERDATLPDERLRGGCETIIRNYDPCISCATHFLKLDIRRE